MKRQELMDIVTAAGATHTAWVDSTQIPFMQELRDICRGNQCGAYDTSWFGPPAIGTVSELKERVLTYPGGVIFQYVHQLEDSYDYPGMLEGKKLFEQAFGKLILSLRQNPAIGAFLPLGAGCCNICAQACTYPDAPCLKPDEACASVEAYGVLVNGMIQASGLKYNNGRDTVSYVGLVLFHEA